MLFLNPTAFYLIGLIPIVVALHFLKLRRQKRAVPSLLFWRHTDEDRRANVPFQRLRAFLLPLLQVLCLSLIIASIARPALRKIGATPGKTVLILDTSASMAAEKEGKTQLTRAKEYAQNYVATNTATGGTLIMTTDPTKNYIQQTFTTDTEKLHTAIAEIAQTQRPHDLTPVLHTATRYADSPQDTILLLTDTPDTPLAAIPDTLQVINVAEPAENIGIVQFNVQNTGERYEVLIGIENFTDTPRTLEVQLTVENVPLDDRTLSLLPGETGSLLFSGEPSGLERKILQARLNLTDAFSLDNTAAAPLPARTPLHLLLVTDNARSLLPELLTSAGDPITLTTVDPTAFQSTAGTDILIFEGHAAAERAALTHRAYTQTALHPIFINPGETLPLSEASGAPVNTHTTPARIIDEDRNHPLLSGVSLIGLPIRESTHRELPNWAEPLVQTQNGPLIWCGHTEGTRLVVFEFDAFNPEISQFAFSVPDAPQFVYQVLAWLEAGIAPLQPLLQNRSRSHHAFRAGEPIRIARTPGTDRLSVLKPDGRSVDLQDTIFTETDQLGVYTLFEGDTPIERFTVNLLNRSESAHRALPSDDTTDTGNTADTSTRPLTTSPLTQEIWHWFAGTAILLLLTEWWFYHQRPA